jgi:hypothetical protein
MRDNGCHAYGTLCLEASWHAERHRRFRERLFELELLSRFPIESLKIDRSFVHGMTTAAHDVTIITAGIAMGRSLKHCVVAEGVETAK